MNENRQLDFSLFKMIRNVWLKWLPSRGRVLQSLQPKKLSRFLPSPGNVFFTLLIVGLVVWVQRTGAFSRLSPQTSTSTDTIAYQGRLADANGNPLSGTYNMVFRLYNVAAGGSPLWTEQWSGSDAVQVNDGLFNVLLGSLTPIPQSIFTDYDTLWLSLRVGTDNEMMPRVSLGSVPFSIHALTVPDESITTAALADGSVTSIKLDVDNGLIVSGNITLTGVLAGPTSYWADYRSYIRFMYEDGVTAADLCPEGGTPVGVVAPRQSLEWVTGDEICQNNYNTTQTACLNVHQVVPCGSIIGNNYPYSPESCSLNFSGKWAPFYWWNTEATHNVTHNILGSGIGCYDVKYACCTSP
ncbi:MAG: hypothetical protein L0332_35795 [Chloroflexi bacterium]|nr:hypothetical protein [Chloroflexota bacterium]